MQLHTKEITDPIAGKENQHGSLFNNFVELFNLSSFKEDETMCKLLYNIALLPLEGMGYADFFNNAFSDEDRPKMQESFSVLRDSFWVFLDNRTITMHPMVREMFARKLVGFDYGYFERYVDAINIELTFDTYNPDISTRIKRGAAAFEIIEILGEENLNIACLVAKIASAYDIIGDKGLSYEYGVKALKLLIKAEEEAQSDGQKYELAYAYDILGYSILHVKDKDDHEKLAEEALNRAKDIIDKIQGAVDKLDVLKTINQGDLAALCLVKKEYQKALEIHQSNIELRKNMNDKYGVSYKSKLIAASYKGVATASYYIAEESESEEEKKKYYRASYDYHEKSIKYYEKAYAQKNHFEIAVATNRQAGTLIKLIKYLGEYDKEQYLKDSIKKLKEAQEYLEDMEPKNKSELKICKENLEQLEKMCKKDSLFAHFDIRDVGKEQSEKLSKNDIIGSIKNR